MGSYLQIRNFPPGLTPHRLTDSRVPRAGASGYEFHRKLEQLAAIWGQASDLKQLQRRVPVLVASLDFCSSPAPECGFQMLPNAKIPHRFDSKLVSHNLTCRELSKPCGSGSY
jgi:hypothetical protein